MELLPDITRTRTRRPVSTRSVPVEPPRQAIAEAAYYLAEKRGFVPGRELEDWLEAEHQLQANAATIRRVRR